MDWEYKNTILSDNIEELCDCLNVVGMEWDILEVEKIYKSK